jgi:nicotinamidase-related amidase
MKQPPPAKNRDLHGNVPDDSPVALVLIDMISDFEFEDGDRLFTHAMPAARRLAALKRRAKAAGVPVIYANDNFGQWRTDFSALVRRCTREPVRGVTGDMCVLLTAADAFLRDLHLVVVSDCVASIDPAENRRALAYMKRVFDARVRPSRAVDFGDLRRPRAA